MEERRPHVWRLFILGRTIVTAALLGILIAMNGLNPPHALYPLFLLVVLQFSTNGVYLYLWRKRDIVFLGYLVFLIETLLITVLIYLLGPDGWVFLLAYLWPIIVSGQLIGRDAILQFTALTGLCFTLLIIAPAAGLPLQERVLTASGTPQALLLVYPYVAFISLLVWLVTREVEHHREDLAKRNVELQRERNLLRSILANMGEAVVVAAGEHALLANRAADRLLGLRQGDALPPALIEATAADEAGRREVDVGGRILSISAVDLPPLGEPGSGALYVAMDVTEQVRAARLKGDFVAYASHELRTPLTTIKMMVRLLLMDAEEGSKEREYLTVIDTQVNRQTRLVNNLLDFTRLESGRYAFRSERLDPRVVAEAALGVCRPLAQAKGVALEADLEPAVGAVEADPSALEQVLVNLLSNAVKFTPAGGRARLACRREGDSVLLSVTDTGEGMTPEQLGRIFTSFYTVHYPRKTGEGTGLGLVISRMLAEGMGGRIAVESTAGRGSCFTVTLPAAAPLPVEAPDAPRAHEPLPLPAGAR